MDHRMFLTLVFTMLLSWTASGAEDEWSRFRGPNGSGISEAKSVPVQWADADYHWKAKLPGIGHSSPVVWGTRIFVTCGEPATGTRLIVCLDTASGRVLWQRDYPSKKYPQHPDSTYATATPAVDALGLVATWTTPDEVVLLALDLDGRESWRSHLGPFIAVQGSGASPILCEDLVVLANDQEDPSLIPGHKQDPPEPVGKSCLVALDRKTGQMRWQVERPTTFSSYATPCVYQAADGRRELIFTNTSHGMTALDPATGKINWELNQKFLDRCVGSPVVTPALVIAGCGAGLRGSKFVAVRPGSRDPGGEPTLAYEVKQALPLVPTPLVKDGRLFLWTDDGIVSCLNVATGEVVWRERVGGAYYGSPVWVHGYLYCIAKNGEVVVLAAADKFEVVARVPLGEASYATPAVAGGAMYLRTRSQLFSLGGKR
jgi:outer membrane protein assembly factor BamB